MRGRHVIMLAWLAGDDGPYTQQYATANLAINDTFIPDGRQLNLSATPVVQRVAPGFMLTPPSLQPALANNLTIHFPINPKGVFHV